MSTGCSNAWAARENTEVAVGFLRVAIAGGFTEGCMSE